MGLLRWLARRIAPEMPSPPPPARPPEINLGDALKVMLVDAVKASGEAVAARTTSDTEFLRAMSEIRNKTAAQALGGIGGGGAPAPQPPPEKPAASQMGPAPHTGDQPGIPPPHKRPPPP